MSIAANTERSSSPRRLRDYAPNLEFNATAVRARAGLLNIALGATIATTIARPDLDAVLYVMPIVVFDMVVAVLLGLTPLSPTGVLGTLLTRRMAAVPTPHMPKRFAWSLGGALAVTCLALQASGAPESVLLGALGLFFVLTWLDATIGFCVGCWMYSKLFGCQMCHAG